MDTPIRVLVADDNACMLWAMRSLIDSHNPCMVMAGTAAKRSEVIPALREHRPDIVLFEIELEGNSCSPELVSRIAEDGSAKVIVFTGARNPSLHNKMILAGAKGIVLKSEPVDVVLRAIKAVHAGELWLKREVTAKIVTMMAAVYHQFSRPFANSQLTPSENRVIAAAVKYRGAPNKVIADVLHMSPNTFRNHLSSIYVKLGIHRRLDLVLYAIQHGADAQPDDAVPDEAMMAGTRWLPADNAEAAPLLAAQTLDAATGDPQAVSAQCGDAARPGNRGGLGLTGSEAPHRGDPAAGAVSLTGRTLATLSAVEGHPRVRLVQPSRRPVGAPSANRQQGRGG